MAVFRQKTIKILIKLVNLTKFGKSIYSAEQIAKLEKEIAKLEAANAELDKQCELCAFDYQKLMELTAQKEANEMQLLELYEKWEELNS